MQFPHKMVNVDGQVDSEVKSLFKSLKSGLVRVGDVGWTMGEPYSKHASDLYNMTIRPNDVWLVTYPKSGTTVTQELVWLLMNDLDYNRSKHQPLFTRSRFIEHHAYFHEDLIRETAEEYPEQREAVEAMGVPRNLLAEKDPSPRVIKSHLPFSLLPPNLEEKCKVIYVARNPKDVCVSYYYHHSSSKTFGFCGTFSQFVDFFINDLVISSPYWEHIREGWQRRNHPNVLFFFYEDFIKNTESTVKKTANFVGKELKENELKTLINHLHIDNFRENVKIRDEDEFKAFMYTNPKSFIRKGGVGKNKEITEEINEKLDKWIAKNQLGLDIPFQMK